MVSLAVVTTILSAAFSIGKLKLPRGAALRREQLFLMYLLSLGKKIYVLPFERHLLIYFSTLLGFAVYLTFTIKLYSSSSFSCLLRPFVFLTVYSFASS